MCKATSLKIWNEMVGKMKRLYSENTNTAMEQSGKEFNGHGGINWGKGTATVNINCFASDSFIHLDAILKKFTIQGVCLMAIG